MSTHYRRDADALHERIRIRVKERAEREARYRRICCCCQKDMGPAGPGFQNHTHGVCDPLCDAAKRLGWGE